MYAKLRETVIESVRRRVAQGDCPTEPAQHIETLEHALLDLADIIAESENSAAIPVEGESGSDVTQAPSCKAGASLPAGWVLVPREPTEAMLRNYAPHTTEHDGVMRAIWRRMIAAASPSQEQSDRESGK
jgi:hypothetical protein